MTQTNASGTSKPHQRLFSSVVLAALDDEIADENRHGNGIVNIALWAQFRDGQIILTCAGIEPNQRCVEGLKNFVQTGSKHLRHCPEVPSKRKWHDDIAGHRLDRVPHSRTQLRRPMLT